MFGGPTPTSLKESIDSTKVEYVQLGSSGLRVSSPILGCMGFGSKKWNEWVIEEEESIQVLKAAYDRGKQDRLTTWDTANVYSSGIGEEIIGKALKKHDIPRSKVTICTKVMGTVPDEPGIFSWFYEGQMAQSKDYQNKGGLSRGAIFRAVDDCLKRLGTDYIDLLQIHRYDPTVPPEETMKALHDVVQSGKVNYVGASSMWCYQFARMQFIAEKNGWTKFISMQNRYNLAYREEEREMIKFCQETGVGIIPYSPLSSGLLAKPADVKTRKGEQLKMFTGYGTPADEAINKRVQETAEKKGVKMSQVALAWLRAKGAIPIVGIMSSDLTRLDDACAIKDVKLTEEEMKYLEEPYVPRAIVGQ